MITQIVKDSADMPLPFNQEAVATVWDQPGEHSCAPCGHRGMRTTHLHSDSGLKRRLKAEHQGRTSRCSLRPGSESEGPMMGVCLHAYDPVIL